MFGQAIVRHLTGKETNRSMGCQGSVQAYVKNIPLAAQFLPSETPNICEGTVAGAFQANLKVRSCFCYIYQFETP